MGNAPWAVLVAPSLLAWPSAHVSAPVQRASGARLSVARYLLIASTHICSAPLAAGGGVEGGVLAVGAGVVGAPLAVGAAEGAVGAAAAEALGAGIALLSPSSAAAVDDERALPPGPPVSCVGSSLHAASGASATTAANVASEARMRAATEREGVRTRQ
jgi:hypothetical protein